MSALKKYERQIDQIVGDGRAQIVTDAPAQDSVYIAKEQEARRLKEATGPFDAADWPLLASELDITADTLEGVADVVIGLATQWKTVAGALERIRLGAKASLKGKTAREANAIVDQVRRDVAALVAAASV